MLIFSGIPSILTTFCRGTKPSSKNYDFEEIRYDLGDKLGFLKATVEFALRRPDLGGKFEAYLKELVPQL